MAHRAHSETRYVRNGKYCHCRTRMSSVLSQSSAPTVSSTLHSQPGLNGPLSLVVCNNVTLVSILSHGKGNGFLYGINSFDFPQIQIYLKPFFSSLKNLPSLFSSQPLFKDYQQNFSEFFFLNLVFSTQCNKSKRSKFILSKTLISFAS